MKNSMFHREIPQIFCNTSVANFRPNFSGQATKLPFFSKFYAYSTADLLASFDICSRMASWQHCCVFEHTVRKYLEISLNITMVAEF
jgi:hypothetical protein